MRLLLLAPADAMAAMAAWIGHLRDAADEKAAAAAAWEGVAALEAGATRSSPSAAAATTPTAATEATAPAGATAATEATTGGGGGVEAVEAALGRFSADAGVATGCCNLLARLLAQRDAAAATVAAAAVALVVTTLERHKTHAEVAGAACAALREAAAVEELQSVLVSSGGVTTMIGVMRLQGDCAPVVESCVAALCDLLRAPEASAPMSREEVTGAVASVMLALSPGDILSLPRTPALRGAIMKAAVAVLQRHTAVEDAMLFASKALLLLAEDPDSAAALVAAGAGKVVMAALRGAAHPPVVGRQLVAALGALAAVPSLAAALFRDGAAVAVILALRGRPADTPFAAAAFAFLARLARVEEHCAQLCRLGAAAAAVTCMRDTAVDDAEAVGAAVQLVSNLAACRDAHTALLRDGVTVVVDVAHRFMDTSAAVVADVFFVLRSLCFSETGRVTVLTIRGVALADSALARWGEDDGVVRAAMSMLCATALGEASHDEAVHAGVPTVAVRYLMAHPAATNADAAVSVLFLLAMLTTSQPRRQVLVVDGAVAAAMMAARARPDDVQVVSRALRLLAALAVDPLGCATMHRDNLAPEVEAILERHVRDCDTAGYACEVLAALTPTPAGAAALVRRSGDRTLIAALALHPGAAGVLKGAGTLLGFACHDAAACDIMRAHGAADAALRSLVVCVADRAGRYDTLGALLLLQSLSLPAAAKGPLMAGGAADVTVAVLRKECEVTATASMACTLLWSLACDAALVPALCDAGACAAVVHVATIGTPHAATVPGFITPALEFLRTVGESRAPAALAALSTAGAAAVAVEALEAEPTNLEVALPACGLLAAMAPAVPDRTAVVVRLVMRAHAGSPELQALAATVLAAAPPPPAVALVAPVATA